MGTKTKPFVTLIEVTDDDTGMYDLGDIEGMIDQSSLEEYLSAFGDHGFNRLIHRLALLQHQVVEARIKCRINSATNDVER